VVVPGAADLLSELSRRGYRLGVISNAHGSIEGQLAAAGICSRSGVDTAPVEIVVDSTIVGVHKPDPAIFEIALQTMGVQPSETAYVGDSLFFDVQAATAIGIHPIHLDWLEACPTEDHPHAADLPAILGLLADPAPIEADRS
jgi:putative hydrolase of the HAD superfamily